MKKYAVLVAICLTTVMLATIAFAAAVKLDLDPMPVVGYGDGKANLNFAKGANKTEIQVNCSGLTCGTSYRVYVNGPAWIPVGDVVAKKNGKINLHARCPGDVSAGMVRINELPGNFSILTSP